MLWVEENQNRVDFVPLRIWFEGFIGKNIWGIFYIKMNLYSHSLLWFVID